MLSINETQTSAELAVSDLIFKASPVNKFTLAPPSINSIELP